MHTHTSAQLAGAFRPSLEQVKNARGLQALDYVVKADRDNPCKFSLSNNSFIFKVVFAPHVHVCVSSSSATN